VDYYRAPVRRECPENDTVSATLEKTEMASPAMAIDLDAARARQELARCLRPMVERLPPPYREAVALVDLAGVPQTEAAAREGLSVSGMKSRVQRGRRALKDVLVECCPVHLDTGGRIVDYDRPGPACTACSGSGEVAAPSEDRDTDPGSCCAPSRASTREMPVFDGLPHQPGLMACGSARTR
jgi:RNA polymerase sigma-70 factor (ECF subfamily)